ncbi:MAG: hypothetical protein LPK19_16455 [Hymenobacteraceae bacterium]|nr:hypothetical protein [Hymenobacteraceae bacterium]MDX5397844.1 hypothetical protein [Hymenobacteraceae bacterium]MDX5513915.1 hypothetical protein [Hymenobacteraceae bacterium]
MKKVLLLKLFFLVFAIANAQTITYTATYHPNAGYPAGIRPSSSSTTETSGWNPVLGGTSGTFSANQWSPAIQIPFAFDFFGQPVTHFKASLNMLVTFDTAATALPSVNDNLPATTLPDKTIAVFWDEFTSSPPTGSGDRIMWKEFGTAPNRQLWIFWYSFEYGNPNVSFAYTAAVLEETTNNVYMVDLYSSTTPALTTTVGVQLNNTTAVQFGNNQVPLDGNGTAVTGVDYYRFAPRAVVPFDASLSALVAPELNRTSCYTSTEPVTVAITNYGTSPISNVPVTVTVSGAANQTYSGTYTDTIAPNATVNLTVGQLNMAQGGTFVFNAATQLTTDNYAANDALQTVTLEVDTLQSLPLAKVDFTGFTGSKLSTFLPDWRELLS